MANLVSPGTASGTPQKDSTFASSSVPFTVFISHAGEDKATIAIPLRKRLRKRGITAFVDEADMPPGTPAKWAMTRAMETAKIGVIVLSPEFIVKEWPMKELMCFLRRREHYMANDDDGPAIPMIVPFFYRLTVGELYEEPKLDRKDRDGNLLHEKSRFCERQERGDPEANVSLIKTALGKLHGLMGVRNTVEANNDSSYDMTKRRKWILDELCDEICKVEGEVMKLERSGDQGHGKGRDVRGWRNVSIEHVSPISANIAQGVTRNTVDGDIEATYSLAMKLENGAEDFARDVVEAERLYRRAIEDGHVNSMYRLARMMQVAARNEERDLTEAEGLLRLAIEGGHVEALSNLGVLLETGSGGVEPNGMEAEKLYRRAIDAGDVRAMNNLAFMLENGADGVERDAVEAERLYRRAVNAGYTIAINNLAWLLERGAEGVERDAMEAEKLYRRAIEAGHIGSMFDLAMMLSKGVEGVKQDALEAAKLFRRAIEGGEVVALHNLAVMLENGEDDVEADAVEAVILYRRAIEAGYVDSMFNLARMLENGAKGVKRDTVEAAKLYRRAIKGGDVGAMYRLGVLLQNGADGVERDAVEAEKLLRRAAELRSAGN